MFDPEQQARSRIEACVAQAQLNAKAHGGDTAEAAMDLMCAYILLVSKSGGDADALLSTVWDGAKGVVSDFWPGERIN
jgi:hypothetical protein